MNDQDRDSKGPSKDENAEFQREKKPERQRSDTKPTPPALPTKQPEQPQSKPQAEGDVKG